MSIRPEKSPAITNIASFPGATGNISMNLNASEDVAIPRAIASGSF